MQPLKGITVVTLEHAIAAPFATRLLSDRGALKQAKFILAGLEVDAPQMRRNIGIANDLVMSEAVMMGL